MKLSVLNSIRNSGSDIKGLVSKTLAQNPSSQGRLGIDIGSSFVKIVWFDGIGDDSKVLGFAVEKVVDGRKKEALIKAFARVGAGTQTPAVISVSGQGVVSRFIELPIMNKAELESSMKFEIEKYVPFSIADIVADHVIVAELKEKAKILVLVAAVKNEVVNKKHALVKELNLNLKAVDLDCLALANFFSEVITKKGEDSCYGIINIGKTVTNLNILVGGLCFLSRDIFIAGDNITKKLKESLEVDIQEAERLKIDPKSKQEEVMNIWEPVLSNLASEIRVSLDYFESCGHRAVEKIYICGGSSRLLKLDEYLKHHLGVEVNKVDKLKGVKFDGVSNSEDFKKNIDILLVALGLALPR